MPMVAAFRRKSVYKCVFENIISPSYIVKSHSQRDIEDLRI